jgi:hypothetical protein
LRKVGVVLLAPLHKASAQFAYSWSAMLGLVRYCIDTVFGQLTDRCGAKRIWARDLWHLRNRLLRIVLMYMLCVLFNLQDQAPPLQLDRCERFFGEWMNRSLPFGTLRAMIDAAAFPIAEPG